MQTDFALTLFSIVILIISVIMHEVAHGYAAYALGDPTAKNAGRLTLNPLAHIDIIGTIIVPTLLLLSGTGIVFGWAKPVPYNSYNLRNQRWGEAIVGFAGVGTNFLLALFFTVVARVSMGYGYVLFSNLSALIVLRNLQLGFFNLIPFPPLDGYTVLRGILPGNASLALRDFEMNIRRGGFVTLIIFLLIFSYLLAGPFYNFVQWVFGILIGGM